MRRPTLLASRQTELMKVVEEACNFWPELEERSSIGFNLERLWNIDECPAKFLPYLAWSLSVPVWREEWREDKQRSFLKRWIYIRSIRGSAEALITAYKAVGIDSVDIVDVIEDEPYVFEVFLQPKYAFDDLVREFAIELAEVLKPLRTYARISIKIISQASCGVVARYSLTKIIRRTCEL